MGAVLGLGPEGSLGAYFLALLQCLFAFQIVARLAGPAVLLARGHWLRRYSLYACGCKSGNSGSSFLRGNELIAIGKGVSEYV